MDTKVVKTIVIGSFLGAFAFSMGQYVVMKTWGPKRAEIMVGEYGSPAACEAQLEVTEQIVGDPLRCENFRITEPANATVAQGASFKFSFITKGNSPDVNPNSDTWGMVQLWKESDNSTVGLTRQYPRLPHNDEIVGSYLVDGSVPTGEYFARLSVCQKQTNGDSYCSPWGGCSQKITVVPGNTTSTMLGCLSMTPTSSTVDNGGAQTYTFTKNANGSASSYAAIDVINKATGKHVDVGTPMGQFNGGNTTSLTMSTKTLPSGTYTVRGQICDPDTTDTTQCSEFTASNPCVSELVVNNSQPVDPLVCQSISINTTGNDTIANGGNNEAVSVHFTRGPGGTANTYGVVQVEDSMGGVHNIGTPMAQFNGNLNATLTFLSGTLKTGTYTIKGQICEPSQTSGADPTCSSFITTPCRATLTVTNNDSPQAGLTCSTITPVSATANNVQSVQFTITKPTGAPGDYATVEVRDQNGTKVEIGTPMGQFNGGTSAVVTVNTTNIPTGEYTVKGQVCLGTTTTTTNTTCSPLFVTNCRATLSVTNSSLSGNLACAGLTTVPATVTQGSEQTFYVLKEATRGNTARIEVRSTQGGVVQTFFSETGATFNADNKIPVVVKTATLAPGTYKMKAQVCEPGGCSPLSSAPDVCRGDLTVTSSQSGTLTCNTACGPTTAACDTGLSCINGFCRKDACPFDTTCTCSATTKKACNITCAVNADCETNYCDTTGKCRNPQCATETDCVCDGTTFDKFDLNKDGRVDYLDFLYYMQHLCGATEPKMDFNNDSTVNVLDYNMLRKEINRRASL